MAFIRLVACFPANDQFDWCTAVRHRFNQQMLSFVVFNPADIRDGIADFLKMESFWIFDRWIKDLAFEIVEKLQPFLHDLTVGIDGLRFTKGF